jgi:hypothetical protein
MIHNKTKPMRAIACVLGKTASLAACARSLQIFAFS